MDSVSEAFDAGKGVCQSCGESAHLIHVFGEDICEKCCDSAISVAEDYDTVLESISDTEILKMIKEGYVIPDMTLLQNTANSKFKGSIPDLMKSYGLAIHKDWNDQLSNGKIYVVPKDHTSGKTHLNQFMIDFSCEFDSVRTVKSHVADADGTLCPLVVNGQTVQNTGSAGNATSVPKGPKAATTGKATKQSSSASVSSVGNTSGAIVAGDLARFTIQLGDDEEVGCTLTTPTTGASFYEVEYKGNKRSVPVTDDISKDFKKVVSLIQSTIIKEPQSIFPAYDGESKNEFSISKYSIYKFALDEYSFGKKLTMIPIYNGKPYPKTRIAVQGKALSSKSLMSSELTKYMDDMVTKKYPALTGKNSKIKTSIGMAVFELDNIEKDNIVSIDVDLANKKFKGRVDGARLSNDKDGRDAFCEIIINAFAQGLIPEFNDAKIKKGSEKYEVPIVTKDCKANVYAIFDYNDFFDTGNISFNVSIIDDFTGEEQPKKMRKFVYKKAGVQLSDFLFNAGMSIWEEFFKKSSMDSVMKDSAVNKMKSPSKKASLLRRIADDLKVRMTAIKDMDDLELELDMKVNKDGKVTDAVITFTDPWGDVAEDSNSLANTLDVPKKYSWLKVKKVNSKAKEPSVEYMVTDIKKFSEFIDLQVYEGAIFEAYGIVLISESGRKVFHA